MQAGQAVDVRDITDNINAPTKVQLITSFGVDNGGEMYVTAGDEGAAGLYTESIPNQPRARAAEARAHADQQRNEKRRIRARLR